MYGAGEPAPYTRMIRSQMYFQHDGAPPHYTRRVTEYLNLSLTAGKVVVDPLHGHRGRQILHHLIIISGATWSEFLATDTEVPDSISGATSFSE